MLARQRAGRLMREAEPSRGDLILSPRPSKNRIEGPGRVDLKPASAERPARKRLCWPGSEPAG